MRSTLAKMIWLAAALAACAAPRPSWVSGGAAGSGRDGAGFSAYRPGEAESARRARDAAYNDAMQKLSLKLRAAVRGEVRTALRESSAASASAPEQWVESLTSSVFDTVLGRKRFEEWRDERRGEYWVRCSMSQQDAETAMREAIAAAEQARRLKTVWISLSGADAQAAAAAEAEFKSRFSERGFVVSARAESARIMISGPSTTEDLGDARPLGVDVGRSCRATVRPQARIAQGTPSESVVTNDKDATGFGRSLDEACQSAARRAAAQSADLLAQAVLRALGG